MLQPDPNDIMIAIYQQLRNPGTNTTMDEPFVAPPYAVRVNCFLFAGLFTSMIVALLGILVKQWTRSYQRDLAGVSSPHLRARIRHFRYNGAKRWKLASIVGLLSIFMHFALFISAIGIIDLLFSTAQTVGIVALLVFLVGVIFFFGTNMLPLFVLDAPFRSPLSDFLSAFKQGVREVNRPKGSHPISSRKVSNEKGVEKGEGLEDHIEQSQEKESDESSIVSTKIHLDLDIICHLLSTADKSTERWLLDLCFEKLPKLTLLEQHDPRAFHSRGIILEVYNFLAEGCTMINKKGIKEINSDRLPRARQLCKFLAWYLSLPQTSEERSRLESTLDKNECATILATQLADDEFVPSIVALVALGHLQHFKEPRSGDVCSTCQKDTLYVSSWATSEEPIQGRVEEKIRQVTSLLVKRTDCMALWEKSRTQPPERTAEECEQCLTTLQKAFQRCNLEEKDKKKWLYVLSEKEKAASVSLKEAWFDPLRQTLDGLQPKRAISPFRPGDTGSSGNGSVVIYAPTPNHGSLLAPPTGPFQRAAGPASQN